MSRVFNWQIGREMAYWYPESRPRKQFAAVFDINKCIAFQTCTLACKTTWTSGKGQEYMLWNNVESKPYGFFPLRWDLRLLEMLGSQRWEGTVYAGQTLFEAAPAGERVLGWRPQDEDYAYPNVVEDDCAGGVTGGRPSEFRTSPGSFTFLVSATTVPTPPAWPPPPADPFTSVRKPASSFWTRVAAGATANASGPVRTRRSSITP
jgi:hypothetical protein